MFYSNDKFCCMCLYESFILKLTNYNEAQPSQQGFSLELPLFHFFIRGYEVGGHLQKPNAEIVCSSDRRDSNPQCHLKARQLIQFKLTIQTILQAPVSGFQAACPPLVQWVQQPRSYSHALDFPLSFLYSPSDRRVLHSRFISRGYLENSYDPGLRVQRASCASRSRIYYWLCPHTLDLNFDIFSRRQSQISIDLYVVGFIV